jgi:hypothetical protein
MVTRDVQISWTAVTGAVVYQVWSQESQPDATALALVATVASPTVSYTFTGKSENISAHYVVKALKSTSPEELCTEANAVQDIYWPSVKSSGWYEATTDTPDGQPFTHSQDVAYLTKEEFIKFPVSKGIGMTASSTEYSDGTLDSMLLTASAMVNRHCNRHFQKQTIDEKKVGISIKVENPGFINVRLKEGPVSRINEITLQVLKWYIPFSLDYIQVFSDQHYYRFVPMLSSNGSGVPVPSVILSQTQLGVVHTNYTCGYDVVPEDIKYATSLVAAKMYGLGKHNPLGLTSFSTQSLSQSFAPTGPNNPIDSQVAVILDKYKYPSVAFT